MLILKGYILSEVAEADIKDIFEYADTEFGTNHAIKYTLGIEELVFLLVENPKMGKERSELKDGLYSFPYNKHIIFYRILNEHIYVVRVLHGSRDIVKFI